jgi:flavin-dependent dehydrogenase
MLDALVVGGGPAGAAAAIALATAGRGVLLVDAAPHRDLQAGESLPPAARPLLRDLGLLDRVAAGGHLVSFGTAAVWGSPEPAATDFVFDTNGHGWHLDRRRFDGSLRSAAKDAGAQLREGVRMRVARRRDGAWRAVLGNGDEVSARTLVDATGRAATAARSLGARRERRDRLVALFASVPSAAGDVDARTLVEAVADGWWYTALVPGRRRVAVLLTDADLLAPEARTSAGFARALADTEHVRALVPTVADGPRTEAAHGSILRPPCGEGWLAAGDAALACDPLSSQGITTALYTGLMAGRALDAYLRRDGHALDRYAQRVATIAAAYERNRRAAYAAEWRWRERPFWARRR